MKVAILGFGVEGKSAYKYFESIHPEFDIKVFDENITEVDDVNIAQVDSFLNIDFTDFDMIVRSPSVSPFKLQKKIDEHIELTSATQIFFDNCPARIIGVTGTKGKGTTSSFIAEILKAAGKTVHLVGNIGVPALDVLPGIDKDDVVVYELSSFQLWDLTKSPHIAVMTILEPDHLEVHEDYQEYVNAKLNIIKHQDEKDSFVYNPSNFDQDTNSLFINITNETGAKTVDASFENAEKDVKGVIKENVNLPGFHNIQNACLATTAAKSYDNEISSDSIASGLSSFFGLPHRLKFVAEKRGVKYYDDSIATTPGSTIAAIKSFDEPKVLILGGRDKGADYSQISEIANEQGVKEIFVIGENQDKIVGQIGNQYQGKITQLAEKKMDDIVTIVAKSAEKGDVVVMSPAASSFDMFLNYKDRGERFVDAVSKLP